MVRIHKPYFAEKAKQDYSNYSESYTEINNTTEQENVSHANYKLLSIPIELSHMSKKRCQEGHSKTPSVHEITEIEDILSPSQNFYRDRKVLKSYLKKSKLTQTELKSIPHDSSHKTKDSCRDSKEFLKSFEHYSNLHLSGEKSFRNQHSTILLPNCTKHKTTNFNLFKICNHCSSTHSASNYNYSTTNSSTSQKSQAIEGLFTQSNLSPLTNFNSVPTTSTPSTYLPTTYTPTLLASMTPSESSPTTQLSSYNKAIKNFVNSHNSTHLNFNYSTVEILEKLESRDILSKPKLLYDSHITQQTDSLPDPNPRDLNHKVQCQDTNSYKGQKGIIKLDIYSSQSQPIDHNKSLHEFGLSNPYFYKVEFNYQKHSNYDKIQKSNSNYQRVSNNVFKESEINNINESEEASWNYIESQEHFHKAAPLYMYRRRPILSVTSFTSQLWCEKQNEFYLKTGKKKETKALSIGTSRHDELEKQDHDIIEVCVSTNEEFLGLTLYNTILLFQQLLQVGKCREITIYGQYEDVPLTGIIDELEIRPKQNFIPNDEHFYKNFLTHSEHSPKTFFYQVNVKDNTSTSYTNNNPNFSPSSDPGISSIFPSNLRHETFCNLQPNSSSNIFLFLTDTKTRSSPTEPSFPQKRSTSLQLQMYHLMLRQMKEDKFDYNQLLNLYQCDGLAPFTLPELKQYSNLIHVIHHLKTISAILPPLHHDMEVAYEHNGLEFARCNLVYNEQSLLYTLHQLMSWWKGQREAKGVDRSESFKCKYCDFLDVCTDCPLSSSDILSLLNQRKKEKKLQSLYCSIDTLAYDTVEL